MKAATSFPAVACWYANQYGTIDAPIGDGITATTVTDVTFGSWTWAVNGKTYPNAATVTTSQQIGSIASSPPVTATEHLVTADGQWRWFFGLSQAALAAQPTTCDLGGTTAPATPNPSAVTNQPTTAPADTGAVKVVFHDWQPGMTPDTFDASLCSPLPQGFDNVTLTPSQDVDPNALPGGPIFTMTSGVNMEGGAFQITGLPAGTYEISAGQNYSGPVFYSPDGTSAGNSTYDVTITADNPTPVLNLYRLGEGIG